MNSYKKHLSIFLATVLLSTYLNISSAVTIEVTAQVGQPGCNLVDAIEAANNDRAVGGCRGGSSGEDLILLNFSVQINEFVISSVNNNSVSGPNGLPIIDSEIRILGRGSEPVVIKRSDAPATPDFRLFEVHFRGRLELENISIQNGKLPDDFSGGGIRVTTGDLIINDSEFINNQAGDGGAILLSPTTLGRAEAHIENTYFNNNRSTNFTGGGGIIVAGSDLIIKDSEFINNQANGSGGAIDMNVAVFGDGIPDENPEVHIENTYFNNNRSTNSRGGAINSTGILSIVNSEFINNQAIGGGAISLSRDSESTLNNVLFSDNTAESGGAIRTQGTVTLSIFDSTISGNSTNGLNGGGGISARGRGLNIRLTNTTISNNSGTGISFTDILDPAAPDSFFSIVNSIVSGNSPFEIGNLIFVGELSVNNSLLGHSGINMAQTISGGFTGDSNIFAASNGDLPTALSDILLPLAFNGGPTQTHALPENSPAIDRATDGIISQAFIFPIYIPGCRGTEIEILPDPLPAFRPDQRGVSRPINGLCDIGAYEAESPSFFVIPLPNGKGVVVPL